MNEQRKSASCLPDDPEEAARLLGITVFQFLAARVAGQMQRAGIPCRPVVREGGREWHLIDGGLAKSGGRREGR